MKAFCDTSFFAGFYNKNDQYHIQAAQILKLIEKSGFELISTDYVYDETLIYLLKSNPQYGYNRAKKFDSDIMRDRILKLIYVTQVEFTKAREIFFKFNKDKQWSFTDCTSYAVMEEYGIRDVLTFDQN